MSEPTRAIAWTSGVLVASATSAAILVERMTQGAFLVAITSDVVVTLVALFVSRMASPLLFDRGAAMWAGAGAAMGIALVHVAIVVARPAPWLAETPPQLVNDVVASATTLGLVAVCAQRRVRLSSFVVVTSAVALYALTHARWHLDQAPAGFDATIQQCVVAQFLSIAIALFAFRTFRTRTVG